MSALSLPNDLANGQSGDATKVQENFVAIETWAATAITKDAAVAMTAHLVGPAATDPTLDDEYAPKQYVDAQVNNRPFVGVEVSRSITNQAITGSADIAVSFDTEVQDTDGFWSSGTTITVPAGLGGLYCATVDASNASQALKFYVLVNGNIYTDQRTPPGAGLKVGTVPSVFYLPDAATVQLRAVEQLGAPNNVTASFALRRLSD